jgi:predicted RNA-binding Zn-ribbon protein involved in translation (DUF1610 family)
MMMNWGRGWEVEAPQKGGGKGKKNPKPGDWYCPGCGDLQFARNAECRRCSTPKPDGIAMAGLKPGDWHCPACGDLQFAKNMECRKCGTPNPDPEGSQAAMEAGRAAAASKHSEKPGDWYCPSCGDLNFARNLECRKCGTPTADPEAAQAAAAVQKSKQAQRPGDWHCTQCGDLQFAKNMHCRRCNTPNYQAIYLQMVGAAGATGMQGKGANGANMASIQQQQQQQMNAMNEMMMGQIDNAVAMALMSQGHGAMPGSKGGQFGGMQNRSNPY